jgi:hypothetical protein
MSKRLLVDRWLGGVCRMQRLNVFRIFQVTTQTRFSKRGSSLEQPCAAQGDYKETDRVAARCVIADSHN